MTHSDNVEQKKQHYLLIIKHELKSIYVCMYVFVVECLDLGGSTISLGPMTKASMRWQRASAPLCSEQFW